jgi:hypothetical protein
MMASAMGRAARAAVAPAIAAALGLAGVGLAPAAHIHAQAAAPQAAASDPIARLKSRLGITPAQDGKFAALVAVMRQNATARAAFLRRNPPGRHRNALAELRVQTEAAQLDARGLQRLLPAFQALYASLSEPQQQIADKVFAAPAASAGPPGR